MRFKSVLGAFIFIILASFIAMVVFVQTKSFGGLVTRIVSDITQRKTQAQVKIKSLSISVFPPGLEINKVSFSKKISDVESIDAEFGKVGLYVSLIEVEERRLTLGEIRIEDSAIQYIFPKKDEELKEIDKKVIDKIFDLSDSSPVGIDTLLVENARIYANHDLLEARRLKIFKKNGSFVTRFHLANIKPLADNDFTLDEVWGDAEINRKDIKLYRLKAQQDVQSILLKGKIKNYRLLKNAQAALNGVGNLHLNSLKNLVPFPKMISIDEGFAKLAFNLQYQKQLIKSNADLTLTDFRSNLFYADELRLKAHLADNKVTADSMEMTFDNQKATLLSPVELVDLGKWSYLTKPIQASVDNLSLNNALRVLGPSLQVLKGRLTGELTVEHKKGDFFFKPKNNFLIRNLGLVVGNSKPFTVLMAKSARLKDSEFAIIDNEFQMNALVDLPRSKLEVDGLVSKKEIKFIVPESQVNLEDLGNIANLDIKGEGRLGINVSGPPDDVVINLKGKTKGFEILKYKLGEVDKNISIVLKDSNVVINHMEGLYGKTHISGTGHVNYDSADMALGITSLDATSSDLFQILTPLLSKVDFLPLDLDLKARVDVAIFGKYRLPDLKIKSKVDFLDLTAYGEHLNAGSFNVTLLNEVLAFTNFDASKGKGNIRGDFTYGLNDQKLNAKYYWENLNLSQFNNVKQFNVNFDGNVSGSFIGGGTVSNYNFKLDAKIVDTKTQNFSFDDSSIHLDLLSERIGGAANLFGNIIETDFNIYSGPDKRSRFFLKFSADDIKPFVVAVFGQHLDGEEFKGRTVFEINSSFQSGLRNLDLVGSLKELSFNHGDFNVNYVSSKPEFVVRNSEIESWNLNIKDSDLFLGTSGEGVFGKNVSLVHELHLNSKIVDILISPVLSAEGFLHNIIRVDGRGSDYDFSISSKTSDLNLSLDMVPFPINNLKYNIEYASRRLSVQDFSMNLDSGTVRTKGDVFFDEDEPDVNLKFVFDRAEIPILGKSSINISGEGIVLGNNLPYNAGGEIIINKAQIVNELNEFSSKSATLSQVRFLPKNQESALGKLLNLNLNVKAENPVRITNSLMDVALKGEVLLLGNPSRPKGEGHLSAPPNSSRIFFKNSEYLITNADINFNPKKEISNPDFDVQAVTVISNYKVYPKAYGDLERFNFDLTSDPALPRNSILSLIAFGYSDEMQSTLTPEQQQNLNQVGVGSFVFDRFKISDILNKQFGLQVNLGTVFEQSQTDSLLAGRSQDGFSGQGGIGRTRSATKIELKKRLDEALTLSVSSTMGGGIGQRQSMNLNYGLTKKVQLEGVYELRTNAEGEEDVIDNSIGGDVKFRWTFK